MFALQDGIFLFIKAGKRINKKKIIENSRWLYFNGYFCDLLCVRRHNKKNDIKTAKK